MRRYETIFVADPGISDEEVSGLQGLYSTAITDGEGQILKSEDWGKKKLAYAVRKENEGRYMLLEYTCDNPGLPHELERRMRINERVLKFLTVRIDNDQKRLVWEKKQAVKAAEREARMAAQAAKAAEAEAASPAAGETAAAPPAAVDTPAVAETPAAAKTPVAAETPAAAETPPAAEPANAETTPDSEREE